MGDYKIVECSTVTDEELERVVNEWTDAGFCFDAIHFAMREGSRRPAMAFLFFLKGKEAKRDAKGR